MKPSWRRRNSRTSGYSVSISVRTERRKSVQFCSTPLSTYEEEPSNNIHVFWWQLLITKKSHTSACRYSMLPCSRFFEVHTYYSDCCPLRITRRLSGFWTRFQRQPSVYVLSGPATVIINIAAASALLADGWSTESVSRVVRTTRTRRKNHERISDAFTVTRQGFNGGKHPAENTTAQDDQEDETEQSSSESLQTRRQISRIHENMGHTSNRNLCSRIFAEKDESDGNRREVTSLEAPWRSDKTERAGWHCKDDY